jgi:hypothetical protein
MTKEMKQYIALGVLGVAALIFVGKALFVPTTTPPLANSATGAQPGAAPAAATPAATPAAAATTQASAKIDLNELTESIQEVFFDYEAERSARNPMRPIVGAVIDDGGPGSSGDNSTMLIQLARAMILTGIIWDETRPLAVLDDQVVNEGFTFYKTEGSDGIVVHIIEQNRVILKVDDEQIPHNLEEQ